MADDTLPRQVALLGNVAHEEALDTLFATASKTIRIFDQTLSRGYNSPARFEVLREFLRANRLNRLQIVVHDSRSIDRNCPRLLNLLRAHAHAISIHETHESAKAASDPLAIADECSFVRRFHFDEMRGLLLLDDPIATQPFIERFGEIWEASSPAVSATTLGL